MRALGLDRVAGMTRVLPPSPPTGPLWRVGEAPWRSHPLTGVPRARVIIDNDFSGDPDDLFQLVHSLLSPAVEIRAVIASHLRPGDPFDSGPATAQNAAAVARDVFARMGVESTGLIVAGSDAALRDRSTPIESDAVDAIIREALRGDSTTPLFYLAGGGLTDLASACLIEPRVADRLTLVWIGGAEHSDLATPPPGAMPIEYNLLIDLAAAQYLFEDSGVPIWQVPRDVYRQCLVSDAELRLRVAAAGELGAYLYDEVRHVVAGSSDTYVLGDSPLVLLTALQSPFDADASSSRYEVRATPALREDGGYAHRAEARPMRVYTWVDTRLMFEDFFLKLREFSDWRAAEGGSRR